MNKNSQLLVLFASIAAFTCLLLLLYHVCLVDKPYKPTVNWDKWDEKKLLEQMENGTLDPDFKKFFDRDPERIVPHEKNIIIAPADGYVKKIKEENENLYIQISLSMWDVHVQRVPISGEVISVERQEGKFLRVTDEQHTKYNFQVITTLKTEIGIVQVRQIAGFNTRRIKVFLKAGDHVGIGDKLGRIMLGSTVILVLPKRVEWLIKEKQKTYAATTIIARY